MICDGYPMELVSKRLGHSSIQITIDTYTHIYEEYQNKVDDSILEKIAEKRYGGVATRNKVLSVLTQFTYFICIC